MPSRGAVVAGSGNWEEARGGQRAYPMMGGSSVDCLLMSAIFFVNASISLSKFEMAPLSFCSSCSKLLHPFATWNFSLSSPSTRAASQVGKAEQHGTFMNDTPSTQGVSSACSRPTCSSVQCRGRASNMGQSIWPAHRVRQVEN